MEGIAMSFQTVLASDVILICGVLAGSQDGISMFKRELILKCTLVRDLEFLHTPNPLYQQFNMSQMALEETLTLFKTTEELATSTE